MNKLKRLLRTIRDYYLLKRSHLFDERFYLEKYEDVRKSDINPLAHYLRYGYLEGRNPSAEFDTTYYLTTNADVKKLFINPLVHYVRYGVNENRLANGVVFTTYKTYQSNYDLELTSQTKNNLSLPSEMMYVSSFKQLIAKLPLLACMSDKVAPVTRPSAALKAQCWAAIGEQPPTITVIIPTWNRANSICRAIDSILAQSYFPLEVLLCDDGSTDDTLTLVREVYSEHINSGLLHILENEHRGVSAARNTGLSAARGELIAYLDSDNAWRPDYLLLMASLFAVSDELMNAYAVLEGHIEGKSSFKRADIYNRSRLIQSNFIDLNIYMHRRVLFQRYGGFDESLRRLVDWDLIARYTRHHEPALLPYVGVDYYLDEKGLKNISYTETLDDNVVKVHRKFFQERIRHGHETLRLAYVIWDFPALSQTFVMNELRWLVQQGIDVRVYFKTTPEKGASLDFDIISERVDSAEALALALQRDQRNLCHSHFAYPAVTLLTHPACVSADINYTFMPHAVDIFHHENRKRNEIAGISNHPLCLKIFVYGNHHRDFLIAAGVSANKIAYNMQAVDLEIFQHDREQLPLTLMEKSEPCRAIVIARFIEKKGIEYLIDAAARLKGTNIVFELYGYGPLRAAYEEKIAALGVDTIRFAGVLDSPAALSHAYTTADMMLVPAVVAENGDMDGFPTVIMEAMAAALPVITTDISAISDYITDGIEALVIPQRDSEALAAAIRQLMAMSPARRQALVDNGKRFLARKTGTVLSMRMLMDVWVGRSIDIFMVTFNTPDYEDRAETFAIIRRVFDHTTTPYTLTIVDNNSASDFLDELENLIQNHDNVRLVRKQSNLLCGPASNIALMMSESEYAIYLCSKEGFVSGHGWERVLIKAMDERPAAAIGGHLAHLPRFVYGNEYVQHPEFNKFRNPDYAREHPDRVFLHVQGGAFILRRSAFSAHGGFSDALPHNNMDVEYSYYLESVGYQLVDIPEVAAITVKTRPLIHSLLDENSAVAHPLTLDTARELLDPVVKRQQVLCNVCGWVGDGFSQSTTESETRHLCPKCGTANTGRSFYRLLAADHRTHRRATLAMLVDDHGLVLALQDMFFVFSAGADRLAFAEALKPDSLTCVLVDGRLLQDETRSWKAILKALQSDGLLLVADERLAGRQQGQKGDLSECVLQSLAEAAAEVNGRFCYEQLGLGSKQAGFDWRPFLKVERLPVDD